MEAKEVTTGGLMSCQKLSDSSSDQPKEALYPADEAHVGWYNKV